MPQMGVMIPEPPSTVKLEHVESDKLGIKKQGSEEYVCLFSVKIQLLVLVLNHLPPSQRMIPLLDRSGPLLPALCLSYHVHHHSACRPTMERKSGYYRADIYGIQAHYSHFLWEYGLPFLLGPCAFRIAHLVLIVGRTWAFTGAYYAWGLQHMSAPKRPIQQVAYQLLPPLGYNYIYQIGA